LPKTNKTTSIAEDLKLSHTHRIFYDFIFTLPVAAPVNLLLDGARVREFFT